MITQSTQNPIHLKTNLVQLWMKRLMTKIHQSQEALNAPRSYMGLNERQLHFISRYNRKADIALVDDKWKTKLALSKCNERPINLAGTYLTVHNHYEMKVLTQFLQQHQEGVVLKPIQGWGGKGILVLTERIDADHYRSADQKVHSIKAILAHAREILSGMYSLGGRRDGILVEELIRFSPDLKDYSCSGVPDIRIVIYRGVPISAMLRLATTQSHGCANLSKGGVGVGIDIKTGETTHAVQFKKPIMKHPDSGRILSGFQVPNWSKVIELAIDSARISNLGFCGVDVVLDAHNNPLLLELNARPGLAIQVANRAGHLARVNLVDAWFEQSSTAITDQDIALLSEQIHRLG